MGITAEEALGASMAYTNKKVEESAGLHREIVTSLPATGDDKTIYMILDSSATGSDIYDEWMWINDRYEHIGSTRVDLTDYYNKTQVDAALSGKADTSDIPTKLSDLSDDSTHRLVSDTEKSTWNGKSNFSGSYNDLSNKPTIPSKLSDLTADASHRTVTDTEKTAWNEITNRVNASSSEISVTISSYNSSGNYYTCPKDGFLNLNIASGGKGVVHINGLETFGLDEAASQTIRMGMFVKQGMQVWLEGANYKTSLYFKPMRY